MLRRRGSAPAVVLQQQFSENRGVLLRPDRPLQSTDAPKVSKIKRGKKELERSCSPSSCCYEAPDKRANDAQQSLDYDSTSPKCPSPVSPGSPNMSIKAMRQRQKRKESEPLGTQLLLRDATARNSSVSNALHRQSNSFRDYNIVLLGQGGVGKSALLVRFMTGRFIHEYDPSLEMTYEKCAEIDDEPAVLHITDTANTHEPVYLSQNEGFIVVYAIDEARTFQTAKQLIKLIRELKKQKGQQTSIVLVGNKVDLNHSRAVAKKEASEFASEYECFFQETSAATNVKVKSVFHDAVRQLRVFQLNKKTNGPMNSIKNFFSR